MAKSKPAEKPTTNALPLFFKRPSVISKDRHTGAQLLHTEEMAFAKDTNSAPLNAFEFIEASKHYPIVFTADAKPAPVAVLGWEKENYFVDNNGQWSAGCYIPAYIRQYPFIFVEQDAEKFFLAIDEAAPNFINDATGEGEPLFVEGEPSALSKRALEFCTSYYQQMNATKLFCDDLVAYKLLTPYSSKATLEGKEMELNGFLMIDEQALTALPDEDFLKLRAKGWLPFIYLAIVSASNWKGLMERARDRT